MIETVQAAKSASAIVAEKIYLSHPVGYHARRLHWIQRIYGVDPPLFVGWRLNDEWIKTETIVWAADKGFERRD
jgi:hypothetical protein